MHIRKRSGDLELEISAMETAVLAAHAASLIELVTAGEPERDDVDPLQAIVGLPGASRQRPADPALHRLLPDAYRDDAYGPDAEAATRAAAAAAEFRRFTEADLRAAKRAHADRVLEGLASLEGDGRLRLSRDDADAWLGFLNDVRLVLGVRLDVDEDTLDEPPPDDDPDRAQALAIYAWLGWVQEHLLENLEPRTPGDAG